MAMATIVLNFGVNANAAGSAKDEITAVENKAIAATTTDEAMKYFDDNIVLYDVSRGCSSKGPPRFELMKTTSSAMPPTSRAKSSSSRW